MDTSKRVYRPVQPSDLPKIQSGQLKVFYQNQTKTGIFSAKLVSSRFGDLKLPAFIVEGINWDFIATINIVVDITPEKRYAIWSQFVQRFTMNEDIYSDRISAELRCSELNNGRLKGGYSVVEFDYPGESE